MYTPYELDTLQDPKDKIQTQLYLHKLQELLKPINGSCPIQQCHLCERVYSVQEWQLQCPVALPKIDVHGNIIQSHQRNMQFNINEWIESVYRSVGDWQSVFWHVWGYLKCFTCQKCGQYFALAELESCALHRSVNDGQCSKCDSPLLHFAPFGGTQGCSIGSHIPDTSNDELAVVLVKASKHQAKLESANTFDQTFLLTKDFFEQLKPSIKSKTRILQKKQYLQRDQDGEQMQEWINNISLEDVNQLN
jgi:hypothetical protein